YIGNVEYEIKEKYRRRGYATRALGLVKRLVAEYESEVDKCLYITTELDNKASQGVILKNGGILLYEGEVPNGDKVKFLNKVDYVKIYTIDANAICES
ncbi:MAG: GNAT family N-acetyltransferase, partial [Bacilli bacterium]|nr:GNAT family N-acetyltransferase [Bacilli bacterium]